MSPFRIALTIPAIALVIASTAKAQAPQENELKVLTVLERHTRKIKELEAEIGILKSAAYRGLPQMESVQSSRVEKLERETQELRAELRAFNERLSKFTANREAAHPALAPFSEPMYRHKESIRPTEHSTRRTLVRPYDPTIALLPYPNMAVVDAPSRGGRGIDPESTGALRATPVPYKRVLGAIDSFPHLISHQELTHIADDYYVTRRAYRYRSETVHRLRNGTL